MINIGIVDDNSKMCNRVQDILALNFGDIRTYIATSIYEIEVAKMDFILLDIDMPDVDGIEFSKNNIGVKIIFVTNMDTRIKESFGPNIYGYVSKDNLEVELKEKVTEIINIIRSDIVHTFKTEIGEIDIKLNEILYCQYLKNHVVCIVYNNKKMLVKSISLKDIKELSEIFIYINRSTIVNKNNIAHIDGYDLYLANTNVKFDISFRNRKNVLKAFFER